MEKWCDYWDLAEKVAAQDRILMIADWQDLDLPSRKVMQYLVIGPQIKNKVAFVNEPCDIPNKVWLKQASIKTADEKEATNILKSIGCSSTDSFEEEDIDH